MSGECDFCGEHCLDCQCTVLDDQELLNKMIEMGQIFENKYRIDKAKISILMVGASCWFARHSSITLRDYCGSLYAMSGVYLQHFWELEEKKKEKVNKKKANKSRK